MTEATSTNENIGIFIKRIHEEPTKKLSELAKIAELDLSEDYIGVNLNGEDLSEDNLVGINLSNSNLSHANLYKTNLSRGILSYADLSYADLSYADLSHADLSHADLSHAKLDNANLNSSNLSYVNFGCASLLNIRNLYTANLCGAILTKTILGLSQKEIALFNKNNSGLSVGVYNVDCDGNKLVQRSTNMIGDCTVNISIILIEPHDLTRLGLRAALQSYSDFKVIGEAVNATEGLNLLKKTKPDVAIIEIQLPDMDGIELTLNFKRYQTETGQINTKILILTMDNTENAVLAAFAAGADSYFTKETPINRLTEAIQATYSGNSWIDPAIANVVLRKMRQDFPSDGQPSDKPKIMKIETLPSEYKQVLETYPLTQRELEILELIVTGCSNMQIAEKLYITVGTVKDHVQNILNKLTADERTQAAVRALRSAGYTLNG